MNWPKLSSFLFLSMIPLAAQGPRVVATGLRGPHKLLMTPGGNFLVTEPSMEVHSGRVSFVSRQGARRSLLEGLPSGIEVVGGPAGPTAMALRDRTLYLALGGGEAERPGTTPGTSIHNPAGMSSAIWSSILKIEFNLDVDSLGGTFAITPDIQQTLAYGGEVDVEDGAGGTAHVAMLVDLPNSLPDPMTIYRFSNPWGLALSDDGQTLYMNDASLNTVLRIDTTTGRWQRVATFPRLPNIGAIGPPVIDPVPTSVRMYGNQLLVSFLTGFPFTPGYSRVLELNPSTGATTPFIFGLSSAVDVAWRPRPGGPAQFFVLEFSQNQLAQPPTPGRLLRYDSPSPTVMANTLVTPVSMVIDDETNVVFVLELATGRILELAM
jgi:hypothetical protein